MVLKLLVVAAFILVSYQLLQVVRHARKMRLTGNYGDHLYPHRRAANRAFWLTLLAVVITEMTVRVYGGAYGAIFWIHLIFGAAPFLFSLWILRFRMTGLQDTPNHRTLGYLCLLFYSFTLATGAILLCRL